MGTREAVSVEDERPGAVFVEIADEGVVAGEVVEDAAVVEIYGDEPAAGQEQVEVVDGVEGLFDGGRGEGAKSSVGAEWVAATGVTTNDNYQGTYCTAPECRVYEFDLTTTGFTDGSHYLTIEVTDNATPTPNVAIVRRNFRSRNLGASKPGGSGLLLRRTSGSQLCVDCHNLPTHSSQTTGTDYGNWVVECLDWGEREQSPSPPMNRTRSSPENAPRVESL